MIERIRDVFLGTPVIQQALNFPTDTKPVGPKGTPLSERSLALSPIVSSPLSFSANSSDKLKGTNATPTTRTPLAEKPPSSHAIVSEKGKPHTPSPILTSHGPLRSLSAGLLSGKLAQTVLGRSKSQQRLEKGKTQERLKPNSDKTLPQINVTVDKSKTLSRSKPSTPQASTPVAQSKQAVSKENNSALSNISGRLTPSSQPSTPSFAVTNLVV